MHRANSERQRSTNSGRMLETGCLTDGGGVLRSCVIGFDDCTDWEDDGDREVAIADDDGDGLPDD